LTIFSIHLSSPIRPLTLLFRKDENESLPREEGKEMDRRGKGLKEKMKSGDESAFDPLF